MGVYGAEKQAEGLVSAGKVRPPKPIQSASVREHPMLRLHRAIGNQAMIRALSAARPAIQTKLAISSPGDEHEREADRAAGEVMAMPPPYVGGSAASAAAPAVQRKCESGGTCADCRSNQRGEPARLQTKPVGPNGSDLAEAPPIVHEALRSPGQPLDGASRAFFEPRFGYDFSSVRIHADRLAAASAHAVGARAYTVGHEVVFARGQFQPSGGEGRQLLAHELAHVAQQRSGAEANVVRRSNGFEDEPTLVERQSPHLPPFRGNVERGGEKFPGNVAKGEIVEKKPPGPTSGGGGGGGGATATFELGKVGALDAALFYLQIHAAHFAALEAVSNKVEIAKDLLSHVAEFEDGARQLRGAVNKLQRAEAALPTVWETVEQAASTIVSLGELEHIDAYATRASNIVSEAFDAKVKLNKIINGWDAVVAQGEETKDFTRQAVVEAAQMLDLRFSKEKGGSFRAFLVAARDDAGRVEAWARSKWYEAKDILDSANLPLRRAMNEAASIRSELMAMAGRGLVSAGVRVAIDHLKTAQEERNLSVVLEEVERSINVLHGIPDVAHVTTRLLLLQEQLQGMSND